ncbi:winged helix-turn-helix domain-containing protein [Vibrio sp. SCSIO 43137]|uniref:winged helix-turn-helix domain-containing protein n=1 Tax=Vibrio sp. SCSIO 43137 TaxID=3021011 RepID=UPI00230827DC|nr:winged helix-turn-helix domain-containing protein [Vibrio sp. SCSIO 43137]WCE31571.1 winged helix-turn-helix domain-containing protein [Vibrio sp. SCSIO 43137]
MSKLNESANKQYLINNCLIFDVKSNYLYEQGRDEKGTYIGANEAQLLLVLMEKRGNLISKDELHKLVWTEKGFCVDESSVIQAISTLRKLLNDSAKSPSYIKTVPKKGYQFIASVEVVESNHQASLSAEVSDAGSEPIVGHLMAQNNRKPFKQGLLRRCWKEIAVLISAGIMLATLSPKLVSKTVTLTDISIADANVFVTDSSIYLNKDLAQSFTACVELYLSENGEPRRPERVIVGKGRQKGWILNLIFPSAEYALNLEISPDVLTGDSVCQRGGTQ